MNGVQYVVMLPRHYSESQVARTIYIELANSISRLIKFTLGTEKLERQLKEPSLVEAKEDTILTYYRYLLIADLRLGDWCGSLNVLFDRLKSPYFRESLLRKVGDICFLSVDARDCSARLRTLAGRMIGEMRGHSRTDQKRIAVRRIEDLKTKELLRRLHLIASERSTGSN